MKFSVLLVVSFFIFKSEGLFARESFDFDLGQKVNVLSDKAYRRTQENEFEAVGNIVITHLKNTIYGEKAKINFTTGDVEVVGNVRYIAPEMTLYGTKLKYNFVSREMDLENSRVLSDNYSITGKRIFRPSPNKIYAEDSEYTTCKDCPESWSIYGKKINISVGEYIHINHAFIKVNGVVVMYLPYIVFPIKQKRETGLLFPMIGFISDEGFRYQQPFFWAIDDYKDLTITPSAFGDRGLGGEIQYRQNIKEKTWEEFNTFQVNDRIYEPFKSSKDLSGKKDYRHFSDLEHHFSHKDYINGHFYFSEVSDLDTIRDFDYFVRDRVKGTEVGGGGFVEGRSSLFSLSLQSYYNRNTLFNEPKKFDNQYVQMLPKISLSSVPYNILQTDLPFLKNISLGLNTDFTVFKQNHVDETGPIRNARRLNAVPYLDWQMGNLGPVFFSHTLKFDYQNYRLPTESDKNFMKRGLIYETEAKIEVEKIFGLSYVEEVVVPIDSDEGVQDAGVKTTIGDLPKITARNAEAKKLVYNNSYRHVQEYKVRHYYLGDQTLKGNTKFRNQIENDEGQFDYVDALRDREHISNQFNSYDSLPINNTIELQWNNSLIRKRSRRFNPFMDNRYLKDNFDYSNIAYFDISQGLDLRVKSSDYVDKLTRLYLRTGISLDKFGVSLEEFYFHKEKEHKLTSALHFYFDRFTLSADFSYNSYNSLNTPVTKLVGYDLQINVNDLIKLKNSLDYNLENKQISSSEYSILYVPANNCWMIEFNYRRDLIDRRFGMLLYINYNDNNFASINVR